MRSFLKAALFALLSMHGGWCFADVSAGVGMSSVFATRQVPGLALGVSGQSFGVFASSAGVRTTSSFFNAYQLEALKLWSPGEFGWGKLTAGFGVGFYLAVEGYGADRYRDWTAGPTIRMSWKCLGPLFVAVDGLFGLRNPFSVLFLSPQDITNVSVGIQL